MDESFTKVKKRRELIARTKKQFNKFVFPSIGAMWFFSLYNMVDGAFVGKGVGANALAGVNISMPYISFLFALTILISVGSSNLIAYYRGRDQGDLANKYFTQSILLISFLGLGLGGLAYFNLQGLVGLLGADGSTAPYVSDYLGLISPFSVFFMLSYNLEILVKADGYPKLSVWVGILSSILNIILDYAFVIRLALGIRGAAIATVIAQVFGTGIYLYHFVFATSNLKFSLITFNLSKIFKVIKMGVPEALTELSIGFTTFVYNFTIMRWLGSTYISTYSIIMYVNNLVVNTMIAINQGAQPLVSFHRGKENTTSLRELANLMLRTALIFGVFFFIVCTVFSKNIVGIFIDQVDVDLFYYSVNKLKIFSFAFIITGLSIVSSGYLTASKHPRAGFVLSLIRGYISISLALGFLVRIFGPDYIWLATIVSELISLLCGVFISLRTLDFGPRIRVHLANKA